MYKNYIVFILLFLFSTVVGHSQCSPDVTPPTITCPANVTAPCPHAVPINLAPTVSDNCGAIVLQTYTLTGATTASSPATGIHDAGFEQYLGGTTTVTYYIEDASGNSATCNFTVSVTDNTPPTIVNCPINVTYDNDPGLCTAVVDNIPINPKKLGFPTAFDNCSGLTVTASGIPAGDAFPSGPTFVTWTVTDAAGNSVTCPTQIVTINDTEDPVITCPSDITVNTDPGLCTANVTIPSPTATDNCAVSSFSNDFTGTADASGIYPLGTTTVTYTATDSAGRTGQCTFTVTVNNNQTPTITLTGPNPATIEACDTYSDPGYTANDSCIGDVTSFVVVDDSDLDNTTVGSYTIYYDIFDGNGVSIAQVTRTVNVVDTTTPTLTLIGPNPLVIGECSTYTDLGATASDNCFANVVVFGTPTIDTSVLGSYTVTYNYTDPSGNIATAVTRTVTVIDITGPDITLLGANPQTIEVCETYTELGATANDPCFDDDYTSNIVIDASLVNIGVVGSYNVTYNVMDVHGNVGPEIIRVVNIVDTTAPSISCPADLNVDTDIGLCTAIVNYSTPVGSDNCLSSTTVQTAGLPTGSVFPLGTTTNTFEVTDDSGFTATCSFDVIVNDSESPMVVCQDITLQLDPVTGSASITPASIDNGSTDNCSLNLNLSSSVFDCTNIGDNIVTLTATDNSGNSSSCDATVTITDLSENASVAISASSTLICEGDSITFTSTPTDGGGSPVYQWQINNVDVPGETSNSFISSTLSDGDQVSLNMTSSLSVCAQEVISNTITVAVNENNAVADAGPDYTNSVCSETTITLSGNAITGNNSTGLWTVTSGQVSGYSFSDPTSPTSTFTGDVGETYTLTWSIDNPEPCIDTSDSMEVQFIGCNALDFDGIDDNVTFRDNYNFSSDFTLEVWIKSELSNTSIQTIISKRESDNLIDGFDLRLVNNIISFNWNNGQSLASPYAIGTDLWYHIAITFDGGTYTLYLDGIEVNSTTGSAPIANTVDCIIGAMDQTLVAPFKPVNYFNGGMDELRIWDTALSTQFIRKMMNQEITNNSNSVSGTIVPLNISGLSWNNLTGYYTMNQSTDILAGDLISNSAVPINGILRNITTLQTESAPIPYKSNNDGLWSNPATWLFGTSQSIPNSIGIDGATSIDWNIVQTYHDIDSGNKDIVVLGLEINTSTLTIANTDPLDGHSITITDYFRLDGILDLVGESQLLQDEGSILDESSSGYLERDQQGTTNLYNYNYWSTPVTNQGQANNADYTVDGVLRDGSNANNPLVLNWTDNYDANPSTAPITLSRRWIYSFEDFPEDNYSDWNYIQETGELAVGLGYTMKGSGAVTSDQNYVYQGKPNNGTISNSISSDNQALIGNPYASAIDANEFIKDNISGTEANPGSSQSIDGTLYFWEHYVSNITHVLEDYEGGYAAYNLTGSVGTVIPDGISGAGTPTKIPGRYIPIGQGFFVTATSTGGTINFHNSQRIFIKEEVGTSVFMENEDLEPQRNDENTNSVEDNIQRVRLSFSNLTNFTRPLLLGFTPDNAATDGIDFGYDAQAFNQNVDDAFWVIEDLNFIIQGVGAYDENSKYELGVFLQNDRQISFDLEGIENFDEAVDVYIYDALLDTYVLINDTPFQIFLTAGDYRERFYIAFNAPLSIQDFDFKDLNINYLQATNEIYIYLKTPIYLTDVELLNILGQEVNSWGINANSNHEIRIPVENISAGTYIIKLNSENGPITKKVIISN